LGDEQLLLTDAARASLRNTLPYSFGALVYSEDKIDLAFDVADSIITLSNKCETLFMQLIYQVGCYDVVGAHNLKGLVLRGRGQRDEAIAEFRKAIEIDPKLAAAHSNLGVVLLDPGQRDKAIAEFRKAIQLDPKVAAAHAALGLVLALRGQRDEAVAESRNAIQLDPKLAVAHYALVRRRAGRPRTAGRGDR
jgi:tetratricopeptide (TPR) repeat protein